MIFKWYAEDFGDNVLAFVRPFLSSEKQADLDVVLAAPHTVLYVLALAEL